MPFLPSQFLKKDVKDWGTHMRSSRHKINPKTLWTRVTCSPPQNIFFLERNATSHCINRPYRNTVSATTRASERRVVNLRFLRDPTNEPGETVGGTNEVYFRTLVPLLSLPTGTDRTADLKFDCWSADRPRPATTGWRTVGYFMIHPSAACSSVPLTSLVFMWDPWMSSQINNVKFTVIFNSVVWDYLAYGITEVAIKMKILNGTICESIHRF